MLIGFPKAIPEIPVSNVAKAAAYYVNALGFHLDWSNDQDGIGGISQGDCRIFLINAPFRQDSAARIVAEPEDKPWRLREFWVADPDGNQQRVFYDFAWELRQEHA